MTLAVLGAMPEEIDLLLAELRGRKTARAGQRDYHAGELHGAPAVLAFSRWGKVAAAATAAHVILEYGATEVLFTGVAGGVRPGLAVGDVVVGASLFQHDLDPRPLYPRHTIPLLGTDRLETHPGRRAALLAAARSYLEEGLDADVPSSERAGFGMRARPQAIEADIASGDQFFADGERLAELRARLPSVACVEMEGAAVAQVCHEYGVPFSIMRVVSDSADESAPIDFPRFARAVASRYSRGVVRYLHLKASSD